VGNLAAVRDVSDVRDVVRAYVDLAERGLPGVVYNVCSGRGVAIREGLDMLLSHSRLEIEVLQDPARLRPLDVPVFVGDAGKLREVLGWTPSTPLEKSLGDLLEYWREKLSPDGSEGPRA
jgi:GDP-4-dehydro-6-deoxy-D-mannose reductase